MTYDLMIIGGGPAACGAAVYAARKELQTLMVAEEIGGQSVVSETIFNWIGTPHVSGTDLSKMLREHVEQYTGEKGMLTLSVGLRADTVTKDGEEFVITLTDKTTVRAQSVLVATGSRRRKLEVPGADRFENKGVMYCATCDGPLFSDIPVAVVGGGNAGFEAAVQLAQYAEHVTLLNRSDQFKADEITVRSVLANPKITVLKGAVIVSIDGSSLVEQIAYQIGDADPITLPVGGVFVEIGQLPNTELVSGLAKLDQFNRVITDPYNQRTGINGLWAAGDCTDGHYHQNNIAVGDAIKAIEDIYLWLKRGKA